MHQEEGREAGKGVATTLLFVCFPASLCRQPGCDFMRSIFPGTEGEGHGHQMAE